MELYFALSALVFLLLAFSEQIKNALFWVRLATKTLIARMSHKLSSTVFKITNYEKYMTIDYINGASNERLYIPIDTTQSLFASQCVVYAHYEDRKEKITQVNDVPLMITANMLGAKKITVKNMYTDIEKTYQGDEIPDYY